MRAPMAPEPVPVGRIQKVVTGEAPRVPRFGLLADGMLLGLTL